MRHERSVVVDRPIDEVWAFLVEHLTFNVPRLRAGVLGLRQTSPGPMGLGSTFQTRLEILGFEVRMSAAITEWRPPYSLSFSDMGGGGIRSGSLRIALKATADGTQVVRSVGLEPRPTWYLLWRIALPFLRRRMDASDQTLKRLVEAGRG